MHSFSRLGSTRAALSANWPLLDWITNYFTHFIALFWALSLVDKTRPLGIQKKNGWDISSNASTNYFSSIAIGRVHHKTCMHHFSFNWRKFIKRPASFNIYQFFQAKGSLCKICIKKGKSLQSLMWINWDSSLSWNWQGKKLYRCWWGFAAKNLRL